MIKHHQYIDRYTGKIKTEKFFGDGMVSLLYGPIRENASFLFHIFTSQRFSSFLGWLNFDIPLEKYFGNFQKYLKIMEVNLEESLEDYSKFTTARQFFERKIRYPECRAMSGMPYAVLSPADCRIIVGDLKPNSCLYIKNKFFDIVELFGEYGKRWAELFQNGSYAVCRLTPEKYHYTHTPVAGKIVDMYYIDGKYHSCNPKVTLSTAMPVSKNARNITIWDTNFTGATNIGYVAMIEVVALMVGKISQRYSEHLYDNPIELSKGMFTKKGCPKSLFHPGSSTVVLLFQQNSIKFEEDIINNMYTKNATSFFCDTDGTPLVETDIKVRDTIGHAIK